MAKNFKPAPKGKMPAAKVSSTPVRNTPIPKTAPTKPAPSAMKPEQTKPAVASSKPVVAKASSSPKTITHDAIAKRAYEIHQSGQGSEMDNWHRAERELRS